jgi:septal ring factor EnvC (AmiA/AmiB activator)
MLTALAAARAELASLQIQLNGTRDERERARAERDESWADNERLRREMTAANAERDGLLSELADERAKKSDALLAAAQDITRMHSALELIAAPMRPDGSYNRDRAACGTLARATLDILAR